MLLWLVLSGTSRSRRPVFGAIAAAAGVYIVLLAVAGFWDLSLVAEQALSPFVLVAVAARRRRGRGDLGCDSIASVARRRPQRRR